MTVRHTRHREREDTTYVPSPLAHAATSVLSGCTCVAGWYRSLLWIVPAVALATWAYRLLPAHRPLPGTVPNNEFCYVNEFTSSEDFRPVVNATPDTGGISAINIHDYVHSGQPFLVSGVTRDWPASKKWNHSYFADTFTEHTLFSSTFSTARQPSLEEGRQEEVYYGIFLNDPALAALVATDYHYPEFIPLDWRVRGNEWLHWGFPPCGAKRHMDIMCTSRLSVQVTGRKLWRLYPITSRDVLEERGQASWSETLHPLQVTLAPGDALVWFPGWEHETRIETGPSVSLSLHFMSPPNSTYQNTFSWLLSNRVSEECQWRSR